MSAVEDAIIASVQETTPGAIVTGFVVVVEMAIPEHPDSTAFAHDAAPGQSVAHSIGLLDIGLLQHRSRLGDS